jgi:sterol desaturase/sphingolipid hydroxylase (fatty acid hydroxylase superfamily)
MMAGTIYASSLTPVEPSASFYLPIMFSIQATAFLHEWAARLGLTTLARSAGVAGALFVVVSLLVLLLEIRSGTQVARYKSRAFINDVLYSAFYRGGVYAVFVWAAAVNALGDHLGFLRLNLLNHLPLYASVPAYWIVGDFCLYWAHRGLHRFPLLWAFHSVHHAEQQLSTLSQTHRHPVDNLFLELSIHFPLVFVLGLPTTAWLPWWITAQMLQALQHAELDWRFGAFYRWVVSPTFHSIHHSTDSRHFNTNFSFMFSIWDYLFGTAAEVEDRPREYGIAGMTPPDSLIAQFLTPFRTLVWRPRRSGRPPRVTEHA